MSGYIYFTPATDVAAVNARAEEFGYGPDSLSVPLVNTTDNSQWFGCHSYVNLLEATPVLWSSIPELNVIVIEYTEGSPQEAWAAALSANDLEQVQINPNEV